MQPLPNIATSVYQLLTSPQLQRRQQICAFTMDNQVISGCPSRAHTETTERSNFRAALSYSQAEGISLAEPNAEVSGAVFWRSQEITPSGFSGYPPNPHFRVKAAHHDADGSHFPTDFNRQAGKQFSVQP